MSERDFATLDETTMTPEAFAQEAKLACLKLRSFPDAESETRRRVRATLRRKQRKFDLELAETIVQTGEQEVVVSLRQYVRSVRIEGLLSGALIGFVVGAVATFFSVLYVAETVDLQIASRANRSSAAFRFDEEHARPFQSPEFDGTTSTTGEKR
ncbi:MAG: hypothetical protein IJM54_12145 [Thermoguttaceae bacterium]|nr:hypothetical protein [Thermoguttaceae bacterium]